MDIAIIDYGVGNLRSIEKAFAAIGANAIVSDDNNVLRAAKALVLPGVGAFGACMRELSSRGFDQLVVTQVKQGTTLLGVCVGMQLLFEESEEFGHTKGLGLMRGSVRRFDCDLPIPHVGWNQAKKVNENGLLSNLEDESFFYFVHSYFCDAADKEVVLAETEYCLTYPSVVGRDNIFGVQFHPEKSQKAGLQLLKNFADLSSARVA